MISAALARVADPAVRVSARRAATGLFLAVFTLAATLSVPAEHPIRTMDVLGVALLVSSSIAAGWASAAPRTVLAVTALAAVGFYLVGYRGIFAPAPATVAVFAATLLGRGPEAFSTAAVVSLGAYAAGLGHGLDMGQAAVGPLWIVAWMLAAGVAGEALCKRRALRQQERERAATAAQRGAEQERLRIARELHDSLTHSISVVNVQASVAAHLHDRDPDRIPVALETIRAASADALRELRATVEVLRWIDADGDQADEPGPGLARLPRLLARSRDAGLTVETAGMPEPGGLPPEVDRAAYRIIQESLANVARHAPGARTRLTLERHPGALHLVVRNGPAREGSTPATPRGTGTGLVGMAERVETIGGWLRTGPDGAGFVVHAELLVTDDPADGDAS
jgi:signal transduction histidine kinase